MIDYAMVQSLTDQGISDFSGGASFDIVLSAGGKEIVNGLEVTKPEVLGKVHGGIRDVQLRYINGESILAGDKRGFFSNVTPIENGMLIIIKGERWRVINARPVNPTESHVIAYRPILRRVATHG